MKLVLCSATRNEIDPTISFIKKYDLNVEVVITGVGMLAASYALTKAISTHKPDIVVQAGVAGSINKNFSLGSVVMVQNETIGDLGVHQNGGFQSVFEMGLADASEWPWENGKLKNDTKTLEQFNLQLVNGVTVNEVSTDDRRIKFYEQTLKADIETMEGAALHYVCMKETISFIQLRSISNYIGERDKTKWKLAEAITNLNEQLQVVIKKILRA